ncbi:MAG: hypothetical protein IPO08_20565 [Xanthomonadales bacterium]|nr:hypothetical protein [Xanthomonadales bacterium]
MAEIPASLKLSQAIEESRKTVEGWAKKWKLTRSCVYRLLHDGKTNNLRVAVQVQRATNGQILPEEWL